MTHAIDAAARRRRNRRFYSIDEAGEKLPASACKGGACDDELVGEMQEEPRVEGRTDGVECWGSCADHGEACDKRRIATWSSCPLRPSLFLT